MDNNPFLPIVNKIRNDNKGQIPVSYRIGTIMSINPLTVDVAGNSQGVEDLLKNAALTSFNVGDQVYLSPIEDEQRYVIICKVVEL